MARFIQQNPRLGRNGKVLYREMARRYPIHTWESYRNRYRNHSKAIDKAVEAYDAIVRQREQDGEELYSDGEPVALQETKKGRKASESNGAEGESARKAQKRGRKKKKATPVTSSSEDEYDGEDGDEDTEDQPEEDRHAAPSPSRGPSSARSAKQVVVEVPASSSRGKGKGKQQRRLPEKSQEDQDQVEESPATSRAKSKARASAILSQKGGKGKRKAWDSDNDSDEEDVHNRLVVASSSKQRKPATTRQTRSSTKSAASVYDQDEDEEQEENGKDNEEDHVDGDAEVDREEDEEVDELDEEEDFELPPPLAATKKRKRDEFLDDEEDEQEDEDVEEIEQYDLPFEDNDFLEDGVDYETAPTQQPASSSKPPPKKKYRYAPNKEGGSASPEQAAAVTTPVANGSHSHLQPGSAQSRTAAGTAKKTHANPTQAEGRVATPPSRLSRLAHTVSNFVSRAIPSNNNAPAAENEDQPQSPASLDANIRKDLEYVFSGNKKLAHEMMMILSVRAAGEGMEDATEERFEELQGMMWTHLEDTAILHGDKMTNRHPDPEECLARKHYICSPEHDEAPLERARYPWPGNPYEAQMEDMGV